MDIQLPEVSGLEVTKWLKEDDELRAIPVIAVTAFAMKGDEERIRQGGCEAYISKPISVPSFWKPIRHPISGRRSVRSCVMTARILVVDDIPANVQAARGAADGRIFRGADRHQRAARRIEICASGAVDIVLLDVMMPGMDGFEVCRRLKANPATAHIPVVMVTALDQPSDRVTRPGGRRRRLPDQAGQRHRRCSRACKLLVRLKMLTDELRAARRDVARASASSDPLAASGRPIRAGAGAS